MLFLGALFAAFAVANSEPVVTCDADEVVVSDAVLLGELVADGGVQLGKDGLPSCGAQGLLAYDGEKLYLCSGEAGDWLELESTALPVCGNGIVEGDEACDDNNTADGDTCSADCSSVAESLRFDASESAAFTYSGTSVTGFTDPVSGVGFSGQVALPVFHANAGPNGLDYIEMAGSAERATLPVLTPGNKDRTEVVVMRVASANAMWFSTAGSSTHDANQRVQFHLAANVARFVGQGNDAEIGQLSISTDLSSLGWFILLARLDSSSDTLSVTVRHDGGSSTVSVVAPDVFTNMNPTNAQTRIGGLGHDTESFSVDIAELKLYDSSITDAARDSIIDQLAVKYDIGQSA